MSHIVIFHFHQPPGLSISNRRLVWLAIPSDRMAGSATGLPAFACSNPKSLSNCVCLSITPSYPAKLTAPWPHLPLPESLDLPGSERRPDRLSPCLHPLVCTSCIQLWRNLGKFFGLRRGFAWSHESIERYSLVRSTSGNQCAISTSVSSSIARCSPWNLMELIHVHYLESLHFLLPIHPSKNNSPVVRFEIL